MHRSTQFVNAQIFANIFALFIFKANIFTFGTSLHQKYSNARYEKVMIGSSTIRSRNGFLICFKFWPSSEVLLDFVQNRAYGLGFMPYMVNISNRIWQISEREREKTVFRTDSVV